MNKALLLVLEVLAIKTSLIKLHIQIFIIKERELCLIYMLFQNIEINMGHLHNLIFLIVSLSIF